MNEAIAVMQYDRWNWLVQRRLSRRTIMMLGLTGLAMPPSHVGAAPDGSMSFLSRVVAVEDGRALRLSDGRVVHLPHILPPGPDRHEPMSDTRPIRIAAATLADLVLGQDVRVDLATPARDRYGRLRAQVSVDGRDVAGEVAKRGTVRVFPEPGATAERITDLITAEDEGRASGAGFWGNGFWGSGFFSIRDADSVTDESDRFEIVQGQVQRVSRIGNRYHLEFGDDWRTDFTAGLDRSLGRDMDIDELKARIVIVRGWLRFWNGPFMEIQQAVQIRLP